MVNDIRLRVDFPTHPKTLELISNGGPDAVMGLIRLWCWAAGHRPGGALTGLTPENCQVVVGVSSKVLEYIIKAGFINRIDGVYHLVDWKNEQPFLAEHKLRSKKASKAAKARWNRENVDATSNATSNATTPSKHHAERNAPILSYPNLSVPTLTDKSSTPSSGDEDVMFNLFWKVYPKKIGKQDARKAWRKITKAQQPLVVQAAEGFSKIRASEDPQFTMYPAKFLRNDRWRDYLPGSEALETQRELTVEEEAALLAERVMEGRKNAGHKPGEPFGIEAIEVLPQRIESKTGSLR